MQKGKYGDGRELEERAEEGYESSLLGDGLMPCMP